MSAFPGEVNVVIDNTASAADITSLIQGNEGTIIGQIPRLGFYHVQVTAGNESSFIASMLQSSIVNNAMPNPVLTVQAIVDLSDKGIKDPTDLTAAIISSPDPTADIILAQIDDFYNPDQNGIIHGDEVEAVRSLITGEKEGLRIHVGELPPSGLPLVLQATGDQAIRALTAVVAGAEINGQKVSVNMSWGLNPKTTNESEFDTTNGPGANSWAVKEWEKSIEGVLEVMAQAEWVKQGNVILNKSSDNGALLVDANGDVRVDGNGNYYQVGIDVSEAMERLKNNPKYEAVWDKIIFYGAVNGDGTLAQYSNHGTDIIYGVPPALAGTSFVSPQGQGTSYNAWKDNSSIPAELINLAIHLSATTNGSGYAELNTSQASIKLTELLTLRDQIVSQTGVTQDQAIQAIKLAVKANANNQLVESEAISWANAIKDASENDSANAAYVTSISFISKGPVTAAVISPVYSGVTVQYSVSGTDGYFDSGTQQTGSSGQVSFTIPAGASGVTDTISVVAVLSGVRRTETYRW